MSIAAPSEHRLIAIEAFRVSVFGIALHAAKPHQSQESFLLEPVFALLGAEGLEQKPQLFPVNSVFERNEEVGRSHIAVVLRDLILQNHVVPEGVPGQLRDQAVVLMRILAVMGEDEIRRDLPLQLLEHRLDLAADVGQKAVRESLQEQKLQAFGTGKQRSGPARLLLPFSDSAEYHPVELAVGILPGQLENGPPAPDFNVVGMASEAQDLQRPPAGAVQAELDHAPAVMATTPSGDRPAPFSQTFQGAEASAFSSSRRCLSLNVSMHCQKPSYFWASRAFLSISRWNGCRTNSSPGWMQSKISRRKTKNPPLIQMSDRLSSQIPVT